jgi:2-polyprenyl-3-methyl-5-hydroxy-6-metoxy-1,4-benzoquinol methylase
MEFYSSIHFHYDSIFPLNPAQVRLIGKHLPVPGKILIDVGCATGSLAHALFLEGYKIEAFDLDQKMIELAIEKYAQHDRLKFWVANMLDLAALYGNNQADGIICFGNTLVHLPSVGHVATFFEDVASVLKPEGFFFFQVLNYEMILRKKPASLPLIDNENIRFERYYHYPDYEGGSVRFETLLTVKSTDEKTLNSVQLLPLTPQEILTLLNASGFREVNLFGSFAEDPLTDDSLPLVVKAIR